MTIKDALLPEFDQEMANTRKTLERVPDGKFDWKPHTKSMAMGALAVHVASIPQWAGMTLNTPQFDVRPVGGPETRAPELHTRAEILSHFDKSTAEARAALAAAESFVFGVQALIEATPADLAALSPMLRFLRQADAAPLPIRADIGYEDDGSPESAEVMNLLIRRNLLFRIVNSPDSSLALNVRHRG